MNNSSIVCDFEHKLSLSIDDFQKEIYQDFFDEVYKEPWIKAIVIVSYLCSLFGLSGLALLVSFERSGLAGQYRTLVDQLTSLNIGFLLMMALIPNTINNFRALYGPLPMLACQISYFWSTWMCMGLAMTSAVTTATKFFMVS